MARVTKLVLTFPDNKTAQQFSGWLYLEGYPDRVLEQNMWRSRCHTTNTTASLRKRRVVTARSRVNTRDLTGPEIDLALAGVN